MFYRALVAELRTDLALIGKELAVSEKQQRKITLGQIGFQSTESGTGGQFLLKDCKAEVRVKLAEGCLFAHIGNNEDQRFQASSEPCDHTTTQHMRVE